MTKVKVRVVKGFALNLQGSFRVGEEVTLHFGRIQEVGVLTPEHYQKLLKLGSIEPIEEVSENGSL